MASQPKPNGTVTIRTKDGVQWEYVKKKGKWVKIRRLSPYTGRSYAGVPKKYTPVVVEKIRSMYENAASYLEIATEIKTTETAIYKFISDQPWHTRKSSKIKPVGTVVVRKVWDKKVYFEKKEEGWVRVGLVEGQRKETNSPHVWTKKIVHIKKRKKKVPKCRLPIKEEPVRFKKREVDETKMKSVRIDSRTTIMVDRNIPDDIAISTYNEKRNRPNR